MVKIIYEPIGVIHSPYKDVENTPIQTTGGIGIPGTIDIEPEFIEGLKDLDGFSHIILLYHFHRFIGYSLSVLPFMDNKQHGVFSTRAPKRPNSIGISIVRLLRIQGCTVFIEDIDIIDGTPLLDIKPYIPDIDTRKMVRLGWLENRTDKMRAFRADDRFRE